MPGISEFPQRRSIAISPTPSRGTFIQLKGLSGVEKLLDIAHYKTSVRAGMVRASDQMEVELGFVAMERIYSLPESPNYSPRTDNYFKSLFKGGRFHVRRLLATSFQIGTSIPYAGFLEEGWGSKKEPYMSARKIFATAVERGIDRVQGAFYEGFNAVFYRS